MPPIKLSHVGHDAAGNYCFADVSQDVLIEQDPVGQWDSWVANRYLGTYPSKAQAVAAAQDYIDKG